jgi:hypothetical protein
LEPGEVGLSCEEPAQWLTLVGCVVAVADLQPECGVLEAVE